MPEYIGTNSASARLNGGGFLYDIHDTEAINLRPLSEIHFSLSGDTAADLSQAENAIWDLNGADTSVDKEIYAQAALNIEAMTSVLMDNKSFSAAQLFIEYAQCLISNKELPRYIKRYLRDREVLEFTRSLASKEADLELFELIQQHIMQSPEAQSGEYRSNMQQVGGSRYHTFGTTYTMPPVEQIRPLLDDLAGFMNLENLLVVEQAAIAHAQFVNIHPYVKGNGKLARSIVNYIFAYRGISPRYLIPITSSLITSGHDYVAGINACKFDDESSSEEITEKMNMWLSYFSHMCVKAAGTLNSFIANSERVIADYKKQVKLRRGSAALGLVEVLPAMPAFNVAMVAEQLGCSFKRASEACKQLEAAGVIQLLSQVKRNRIYYSKEMLDVYMDIAVLQ